MVKNNYIFLFFLIISSLCAAEIIPEMMSEIVVDKSGSYHFERRLNNEVALVHTDPRSAVQTTRLLPPTLFPLTSIIQSGSATNQDIIQNLVTIVANDVIFNINGFNLTQGLVIRGSNVTVKNGLIDPTAVSPSASLGIGVNVAAGSSNVILDSLTVRNAAGGIILTGVSGGVVSNCEVLLSSTGLSVRQSNNVIFERCTAMQCSQVGFAMLMSSTNICRDCTALATGYGNTTVTNNNVHGFIATNGYGNVFERCIANATQALSTTDPFPNSLVSGITLDKFEQATKIIGCESSNTLTSPNGVTIPFGILLAARLSGLTTVTIWNPGGNPSPASNALYSVAWSPDGIYLAAGGAVNTNQNNVQLYTFNYTTTAQFLTQIISTNPASTSLGVFTTVWSPDGNYLAVGGQDVFGGALYLYGFDRDNQTLSQLQSIKTNGAVNQASWSLDGKYLAAASDVLNTLNMYKFDEVAQNLTSVTFLSTSSTINSVAWSPDDNYLAVGTFINNGAALYLYSFNRSNNTLALLGSFNPDGGGGTSIYTVAWSPDGQYLAVGGALNTNAVVIYGFNPNNSSVLTLLTVISIGGTNGSLTLTWSPDGTYLVVGGSFTVSKALFLYKFDRGSNQLLLQQSINPYTGSQNFINAIAWSPDGQYLAIGESLTNVTNSVLFINQVLTFPSNNVIKNNTVYCNSGAQYPSGIGISGSSIANLIIQNTSYANPMQLGVNMPFVPTNYAFVQNVFNQNFGDAPTGLQNIAMGYEQVVRTPPNVALLAQQLSFDVFTSMSSEIASLSLLLSSTTVGVNCLATQITTGTTTTTITAAGIYCLGTNMANSIVINSSNVQLNLNNLSATSGIQVGAGFDQVTIFNGSVSNATDGAISVTAGATNLTISQVRAHDSIIGINLTNVTNARIAYCDLFSNDTGIGLTNCVNVSLDKCVARSNLISGFSLLNSSTNVLRDCEALSTGDLSTSARQNIFGFVSNSGAGNVFERCIANSTQGLTVTAADSVVAGFALRGSEQYSKIIACESSNATTSPTGVTIPYGIWLESQFSGLVSVTSVNAGGSSVIASSAKWSRDGVYLAVLPISTTNTFIIYKFDYLKKGLVQVATATQSAPISALTPASLVWSPDGNYLIASESIYPGSDNGIFLYRFDKLGQSVQLVTSINTGVAEPVIVDWSPDGKYVAVAIDPAATGLQVVMLIYQFDEVNQTLQQVATLPSSQVPTGSSGLSVAWSPDGNYVALGLGVFPTANDFYLYRFDRSTTTLIQVDVHSIDPGSNSTNIYGISWSFDGQYVAVGGGSQDGSFDVNIFQFNRATQTLSFVTGLLVASASGFQPVYGITWSPDGKYLAFGGNIYATGNTLYVYQFNRGSSSLSQVAAVNPDGGSTNDIVYDVQWSPDGQYLAIAGKILGATNNAVIIYQALTFPKANVVMDNTVYCNSGALFPSGIGISGSSIANMIIQNNAYSNPLNQNSQNPLVPSNYIFVTNVFNPILQNRPTLIQNIGIGDAQVVPQPQDTVLLAKQMSAQITQLGLCSPTVILAPTSITASGVYCLGQDITGNIVITSTCVEIDLNKRSVYGSISFLSAAESIITNGFIIPPNPATNGTQALSIDAGCFHVTASNLFIDCSLSVTTANAVQGQDSITVAGLDTQLKGCTIKAGNATAATTAGAGVRGGHGINVISGALRTIIQDCVILKTGNGGAANGAANAGGDAGHGIHVASGASLSKISNCLIMSTGVGGAGGASAAGGRGGDAVRVESGAQSTEVRNCRMRNTGTGGSGSTLGVPGKAVFDLVTTPTTLSSIFTNFAFSIANPTKFDIQAATIAGGPNVGVQTPNPPTSGVINLFANVFSS